MYMTKSAVIKGTGFLHQDINCPQIHGVVVMEVYPEKITHKRCGHCSPNTRQLDQRLKLEVRNGKES